MHVIIETSLEYQESGLSNIDSAKNWLSACYKMYEETIHYLREFHADSRSSEKKEA